MSATDKDTTALIHNILDAGIAKLQNEIGQKDVLIARMNRQIEQLRVERDTLVGRVMDLEADVGKLADALERHAR